MDKKIISSIKNRFEGFCLMDYLAVLSGILLTLLYMRAATYSMYEGDIISFAIDFKNVERTPIGIIKGTFDMMKFNYQNWQGTFASQFADGLMNPLVVGGFTWLRLFGMLHVLLFFGGVFFLVKNIREYFKIDGISSAAFFSAIMLPLMALNIYNDSFYTFASAIPYTFWGGIFFFGIALCHYSYKKSKKVFLPLIAFIMFMTGGASLETGGMAAFILLGWLVIDYLNKKKLSFYIAFSFGFCFLGALIDALSPGNFIRQQNYGDESVGVFSALLLSGETVAGRWFYFIFKSPFGAVMLGWLLWSLLRPSKESLFNDKLHRLVCIIFGIMLPVVTIFPVIYGYRSNAYLPERTLILMDLCILMVTVFFVNAMGSYLAKREIIRVKGNFVLLYSILLIISLFVFSNGYSLENNYISKTAVGLVSGQMDKNYQAMRDVFCYIIDSEDSRVYPTGAPENLDYYTCNHLKYDADHWVNKAACQLWDKEEICLK